MRELIAPSIQLKDGSTYIPEGWMWLLAFAVQGHKWAVDEISKPECQIQIERWRREKIVQFYESERDDLEAAIAQLERDVAVVRDKINIVRRRQWKRRSRRSPRRTRMIPRQRG